MIDYRVNADRQRRLAFRRFKSYVSRRPGELAATRKTVSTTRAVPGDPWRAVAAFSGENLATFLANKLRYSLFYKLAGLLVVVFCVLVSSFLAVTYARIRGGTTLLRGLIADKVAKKEPQALTFLVLGADDMNGERGRSDAIMLVRLDLEHKRIRCLSVPRDSYVLLRQKGDHMDKLNHAYFYGGPELSKSTLEEYTDVKVDYYGVVNYELFEHVVDLAGGVPVDVDHRLDYDDNAGNLHVHLAPGPQVLDGVQAKGYVRFRHDNAGDFGRMKRQQKFAKALLERLKSPKVIALIAFNLGTLFSYVKTDVPMDLAAALLLHFKDFDPRNVEVRAIPSDSKKIWAPRYKLNLSFMISKPEDVVASREWLMSTGTTAQPATPASPASAAPTAPARHPLSPAAPRVLPQ